MFSPVAIVYALPLAYKSCQRIMQLTSVYIQMHSENVFPTYDIFTLFP
jgi:hypothetical protein